MTVGHYTSKDCVNALMQGYPTVLLGGLDAIGLFLIFYGYVYQGFHILKNELSIEGTFIVFL